MKKILLTLTITWLTVCFAKAQNVEADQLVGVWEPSHGKARIKIEKIGDKYYGKIVWLREPIDPVTNQPKVDKNNPDESMRQVPLKGYRILKDFQYSGKGEWTDGTIYDPENGNTYNCVIKMRDENTLDIRGYIGVKALGRTDVWTRVAVKKKD
ncbi:MAG: DUF2147 domain-containing protein [Thermaurantimonas sp.]|uniref:DUF2147 domain-containing protein n=1 Tax=Thermaurantimonas sp. TaxID=2681568 RepID=UPI00391C5795